MLFALLLSVSHVFAAPPVADGQVRYVFKGDQHPAEAKPFSFGLETAQVQAILDLTGGQINFGDVYYVDRAAQANVAAVQPGLSSTIHPHVQPPVVDVTADPELAYQWWFKSLNVEPAWEIATGQGVTVADCDAGLYWHEQDTETQVLSDLRWDFSDTDEPTVIDDGNFTYHGTAVTAIMLGALDGKMTNGIAFNAKEVPFQNFNYDESKDKVDKEEATSQCILRAIKTPNVSIIVLENQTETGSSETFIGTRDAVRLALKSGIIVVGAGGNYSVQLTEEAKDDTGSIIVGAVDPNGRTEKFSNYGDRITIAAYGEQLHTLYGPKGRFGEFGGTSGATPQVAATIALMKEVQPMMTPAQARQLLIDSRVSSDDNRTVGGQLDVLKSVQASKNVVADVAAWTEASLFRQRLSAILK